MVWISSLMTGVCLALLAYFVLGPLAQYRSVCPWTHLPAPLAKALWPWIWCFIPLSESMLTWRYRTYLAKAIETAGLDQSLEPSHVLACQWALAGGVLLFTLLCIYGAQIDWVVGVLIALCMSVLAAVCVLQWLKKQAVLRQQSLLRQLPFMLDMITLSVRAGLNIQSALEQAARHGPAGPLKDELQRALGEMRTGVSRLQALQSVAQRSCLTEITAFVSALRQADQFGMNLGPLLIGQATQRRSEAFQRAEKLAMQAPVKMLFPLVLCIFPCTFMIIGFPVVTRLLAWS